MLDIETTLSHGTIWLAITRNLDTDEVQCHTAPKTLNSLIGPNDLLIGHNIISFDAYHLNRLWGTKIRLSQLTDTLMLSRLLNPEIEGGHSLDAWGRRLKTQKGEFKDFNEPAPGETKQEWFIRMRHYCEQDTEVTAKLYRHLDSELKRNKFSEYSRELEHKFQAILALQQRNGWFFDMKEAITLLVKLKSEEAEIVEKMQSVFEPTIVEMKTKTKTIQFNPGSRQQIADRLIKRGWEPKEKTPSGQVVVNEKTLKSCTVPEAQILLRYMMLTKRTSQIEQWVEAAEGDGRIHANVISSGAVTGRCTCFGPNLQQVVSSDKEYGHECRALFLPDKDWKLVGIDASGLELRMLAHYMGDEGYITTVTTGRQEDGTDIHSVNQRAAGLQYRSQAKTFIYALLYGAGSAKIGSIIGAGSKEGQVLIDTFMDNMPALKKLLEKVKKVADKGYVPGLDGRRIWIRSPHAALNSLLQGGGAAVMKIACVLLSDALKAAKIPHKFLGNIHDEWQITTPVNYAEQVGIMGVQAIRDAGTFLKLKCPLDGEYKIGNNWSETH